MSCPELEPPLVTFVWEHGCSKPSSQYIDVFLVSRGDDVLGTIMYRM